MNTSVKYILLSATTVLILILTLLWTTTRSTDYYFNEDVMPATVKPLIQILENASYGEVINIHVTTYGGDMFAGLDLIKAIRESHATVNIHVTKLAASAGAYLLCAADNVTIDKGAIVLFHTFHTIGPMGMPGPNMTDKDAKDAFDVAAMALLKQDIFSNCKKILTQDEINRVLNGEDVVINH